MEGRGDARFTQADLPRFRRETARLLLGHPPADQAPETEDDEDELGAWDGPNRPRTNCGCSGCNPVPVHDEREVENRTGK